MTTRLLYLVSHPIQYQAPLLRLIAGQDDISLRVLFEKIPSGQSYDPGFDKAFGWDVPLVDGYDHARLDPATLEDEIGKADVVWLHGWQSRTFRRALRIAGRLGRPTLMRGENWEGAMPDGTGIAGRAKQIYLRRIFRACSAFLAIGSKNRDYYLARGVVPERIFPVPYAVDNAFFREHAGASGDRRSLAVRHGLNPELPIILFSGKLIARKRLDLLLRAMALLPDPAQLLVVGDGPMRNDMQALSPRSRFVGFRNQTELPAFYHLADVFVMPSEKEPWGLALNEAMACGTAVVASDQVGAAFDIVDETCGRIFRGGDPRSLADAMLDVLANPAAMGEAAARKIAAWSFEADLAGLRDAIAYCKPATS